MTVAAVLIHLAVMIDLIMPFSAERGVRANAQVSSTGVLNGPPESLSPPPPCEGNAKPAAPVPSASPSARS
jgi:hypothetical protein